MAVLAAQLLHLPVHHVDESVPASRHMLCKGVGGLVRGCQQQQIEAVLHREDISLIQGILVSAASLHVIDGVVGEYHLFVQGRVLQNHQGCQKLGDAGRRLLHVNPLSVEDRAGIQIHDNARLGQYPRIVGPYRPP